MHLEFKRNEWLTETQIQQFFARLAAKQRSRDPTEKELTKEELVNAEVPDEEVDDILNYIQAAQQVQLANDIEQDLELADVNDNFHPYLVEDLRLCVLAKSMKESSIFTKSKIFRLPRKKLFSAMNAVGVDLPPKSTKEEIGIAIVDFIEKSCDCLTFVE